MGRFRKNNEKSSRILELILFVIIAFFSIRIIENPDFWFHLKYGEYVLSTKTLPFQDVFSHSAFGNSAIPYEWLFQVVLYLVHSIFSTVGVQVLVVFFVLTYNLIFRQILVEIFRIPLLPRMTLIAANFALGYDFWVERPQIAAYTLFMAVLYLVLKRVFKGINWLWLTIPLFYIWANLHASMILGLYLFFSIAAISFLSSILLRQKPNVSLLKHLLLFGGVNSAMTILPPLGTNVYQLLYIFFIKREFISEVITEWVPLYQLGIRFHIYLVIIIISLVAFAWSIYKRGKRFKYWLLFPLIPLSLFVITGVRHTAFTIPLLFILTIPALKTIPTPRKPVPTYLIAVIIFITTIISLFYYRQEVNSVNHFYPKNAIPFIQENLSGNMFNDYQMGGFLMYHLGPEIKTFIDGRTDMFLPQVLPDYIDFIQSSYTSDEAFAGHFHRLTISYNTSWVILPNTRFSSWSALARLLLADPQWHLVYFDDSAQIYVKDKDINSQAIKNFTITSATPFSKTLYRDNQKGPARVEYQSMQDRAPSAVALNALGFMLLEDGNFKDAQQLFLQALEINPDAAAPKMNLAELAAKDGSLNEAIRLYRQAIKNDPTRGLAYLRLGQLIIQSGGSKKDAEKTWQKGLLATPDEAVLKKLEQALRQ